MRWDSKPRRTSDAPAPLNRPHRPDLPFAAMDDGTAMATGCARSARRVLGAGGGRKTATRPFVRARQPPASTNEPGLFPSPVAGASGRLRRSGRTMTAAGARPRTGAVWSCRPTRGVRASPGSTTLRVATPRGAQTGRRAAHFGVWRRASCARVAEGRSRGRDRCHANAPPAASRSNRIMPLPSLSPWLSPGASCIAGASFQAADRALAAAGAPERSREIGSGRPATRQADTDRRAPWACRQRTGPRPARCAVQVARRLLGPEHPQHPKGGRRPARDCTP